MTHRVPLMLLLAASGGAVAAFAAPPVDHLRVLAQADDGPRRIERRFVRHDQDEPRERETVAFLGVEASRVSPALTAQLGLRKNIGLVVREVVPDSPAAAAIQKHDVLLKLDDQWLIESRQFSVLIRDRKPGDEVTLTYVRAGKESTAKLKLIQREVPKLAFDFDFGGMPFEEDGALDLRGAKHVLPLLNRHGPLAPPAPPAVGRGLRASSVAPENSNLVFNDERGVLELTIKDGKKSLVAKNPKGEQVFAGPINSPEERAKLPAEVKQQLDEVEGMRHFSFEVGPEFEEDVKILRPGAQPIASPHHRAPAPAAPQAL